MNGITWEVFDTLVLPKELGSKVLGGQATIGGTPFHNACASFICMLFFIIIKVSVATLTLVESSLLKPVVGSPVGLMEVLVRRWIKLIVRISNPGSSSSTRPSARPSPVCSVWTRSSPLVESERRTLEIFLLFCLLAPASLDSYHEALGGS
ncbi:unnamed protein product [Microthlaspi erraticum]|uniref:Uncharacterized protein n=1 Tax=Microthlaspi erraticum TaxID=1685480 RepID=A0A6D2IRF1_9BRAS|nr:unnamed protein product [Microthlaspi erraticum]